MLMTTAVQTKRCTKCQKDLAGAKRLKDSKGQYWCPECGVGATPASGTNLVSPCPKCHTPVHAAQLVRDPKSGSYVCEHCAAGAKTKGGKAGAAPISDEEAAKKKKTILAVAMIVAGGIAYYTLNYVLA